MSLSANELRAAIQAIIFLAGEPVRVEDLTEAFSDESREAIEMQLQEIDRWLRESESGIALEQTAGGYRFATRPELDPFLRKFFARRGEGRLSMAALETLAIIAYRQPVTAPEVSEIRGVNSSGVMRTLLERKMIRIAGRKNVVGSPFLYRTTRDFLVHFGLNSIQDLPRLEEFAEILGENMPEELLEPGEAAALSQDELEETAEPPMGPDLGGEHFVTESQKEHRDEAAENDVVVDNVDESSDTENESAEEKSSSVTSVE